MTIRERTYPSGNRKRQIGFISTLCLMWFRTFGDYGEAETLEKALAKFREGNK